MNRFTSRAFLALTLLMPWLTVGAADSKSDLKSRAEDKAWLLPASTAHPEDNAPTSSRVSLGKMLFFDPRLSKDGTVACSTCHNPALGWSDGLPTAHGLHGKVLPRRTPSIYNTAYNSIQMWDGRKADLEDQATGPLDSPDEMAADYDHMMNFLRNNNGYKVAFNEAYPGAAIDKRTLSRAIASYERTIVSTNSPFDRWLHGDTKAMTPQQVAGFRIFTDPARGNCSTCHQAPNFTDNGFHNIGLASYGRDNADMGRYAQKPVGVLKGAFKTPGLRNVTDRAPYFHDGSAATLEDVVEHYARGGDVKTNLSPNMKEIQLSADDKQALVAFLKALTSPNTPVVVPVLP